MLYEKKHCEDPIERKILKVKVLADALLVNDDQTLESVGLLHDESEVTVIYSRNEVEAATTEAINAEGLLQVNIPSSLKEISAGAFQGDDRVVMVAIPESVTTIGDCAFQSCKSLENITIPESVTTIGDGAFQNCQSLANITIPESVTTLGDFAFQNCESLANITMPESVTTIGVFGFQSCKSLANITIPESVTTIGDCAFQSCKSLANITIPESVTTIGDGAFQSCKSLANITIPKSVTTIGDGAFHCCESLASITIPQSVTFMGDGAFQDCRSLKSITIPESLMDNCILAFDEEVQAIIRHVWRVLVCCSSCNLVFKIWIGFQAPMGGQCNPSDQLSVISNSRQRKRAMKPSWLNIAKGGFRIGKSDPKYLQPLQLFFWPHPKKLILRVRIWEKYFTPCPHPPKNFPAWRDFKHQLLSVCWWGCNF